MWLCVELIISRLFLVLFCRWVGLSPHWLPGATEKSDHGPWARRRTDKNRCRACFLDFPDSCLLYCFLCSLFLKRFSSAILLLRYIEKFLALCGKLRCTLYFLASLSRTEIYFTFLKRRKRKPFLIPAIRKFLEHYLNVTTIFADSVYSYPCRMKSGAIKRWHFIISLFFMRWKTSLRDASRNDFTDRKWIRASAVLLLVAEESTFATCNHLTWPLSSSCYIQEDSGADAGQKNERANGQVLSFREILRSRAVPVPCLVIRAASIVLVRSRDSYT